MRAPQLVSDFFEWRWAPCVGLTTGSLTFVALALLVIPTHFGGEPRVVSALSSFDSPQPQRALFSSSLARSASEPPARRSDDLRVARSLPAPSPRGSEVSAPPARGFSPILDRPEPLPAAPAPPPPAPPPAPPAPPPAVEPPAPEPGTAVVTQPEPGGPSRESGAQ